MVFSCKMITKNNSGNHFYEWIVSNPSDEGIDSITIDSIKKDLSSGKYGLIDHILIIKNGKLVFNKQFKNNYDSIFRLYDTVNFQFNYDHPDWHPYYKGTDLHTLQSCTKSITSLLTGIAIDKGKISNTDNKVMNLFNSYNPKTKEALRDSISLQDLLTMRAGFKWDESSTKYFDPKNNCYILENSDNWLDYVLGLPMDTIPGTKFVYNGGITVLLGEIIRIKTGMRIDKWAEEKLFKPLDITSYYWKTSPHGEVDTEGGLYLSIYDFAKIGQLILNNGIWQGKRIISENWLLESTVKYVKPIEFEEWFGYHWWIWNPYNDNYEIISALGFGDQILFIDRENNLLIVMNGWNIHESTEKSPYSILKSVSRAIKN